MIEYSKPLYKDFVFNEILEYIPKWTWQELKEGLKIKIINRDDVVNYAQFILEENIDNFDAVLELSIANRTDDIEPILNNLIFSENIEEDKNISDKWRFAILLYLYLNKGKYENIYEKIAEVAADFHHPKDMNGFIYYLPIVNNKNMKENWINYLKEQNQRFSCKNLLSDVL